MTRRAAAFGYRVLAALLLVLVTTVALGPVTNTRASAIDACLADPPISAPSQGVTATLDPGPQQPRDGDPFAKGSDLTPYEVYGYAGMTWINYDPGCLKEAKASAWSEEVARWLADTGLGNLAFALSAVAWLIRLVFNPATMAILDPMLRLGSFVFGGSIFLPALAVTGAIAGLWFLIGADRDRVSDTAKRAATAAMIACVGVLTIAFPLVLGHTVDKVLTATVATAHQQAAEAGKGMAGLIRQAQDGQEPPAISQQPAPSQDAMDVDAADAVIGDLHRALLWETWRAGEFGRASGPTADKYGPALFQASVLSRTEDALPADQRAKVIDAKAKQWKDLANKIQDEDPEAYSYIAGHHNKERLQYVTLAWAAFGCICLVFTFSLGAVLFAMFGTRIAITLAPLVATFAVIPPLSRSFWKLVDFLGSIVFAGLIGGCLSALYTALVAGLLSPSSGVPVILAALVLLMVSIATVVALFKILKKRPRVHAPKVRRGNRDKVRDAGPEAAEDATRPYQGGYRVSLERAPDAAEPAEARPSTFGAAARGAASGAFTGAASTVVLGALSGGSVSLAAAAAGAARGAVATGTAAGVHAATGSAAAGLAAGAVAGHALPSGDVPASHAPRHARAVPAQAGPVDAPALPPAAAPALGAAPTRVDAAQPDPTLSRPPVRVFRPEDTDAPRLDHLDLTLPTSDGAYPVWTPNGSENH